MEDYGLDLHGRMILEEFRELEPVLFKMKDTVLSLIRKDIADKGLMVTATEADSISPASPLSVTGCSKGRVCWV